MHKSEMTLVQEQWVYLKDGQCKPICLMDDIFHHSSMNSYEN